MATIACKILKADKNEKGIAIITVEFDDGVGKWKKSYNYNQTSPIDFAKFKDMLVADLSKDLKVDNQLSNISSQVGKKFNITI